MSLAAALAWAQTQPEGTSARALADAITSGTRAVAVDGRRVEYRDLAEIERALIALWQAEAQPRRVRMVRITSAKGV